VNRRESRPRVARRTRAGASRDGPSSDDPDDDADPLGRTRGHLGVPGVRSTR
jgi:hypothetical protein